MRDEFGVWSIKQIADAFEHHGLKKQYIPKSVIDDIRAEIDERYDIEHRDNVYRAEGLQIALDTIDKHIKAVEE